MKKASKVIILFMLIFSFAVPSAFAQSNVYQVQHGDTLWSIAQAQGISLTKILELNNKIDPNNLVAGQKVLINQGISYGHHVVKQTDTLHAIGELHGVPVDVLMDVNQFTTHTNLYVGQKVLIPLEESSKTSYQIKAGDSYWTLSQRFNTTVEILQELNNQVPAERLTIGTVIQVPAPEKTVKSHLVKTGDTLYHLAKNYGTSVEQLMEENNISKPEALFIGQELSITL